MSYVVIHFFTDLQDFNHPYKVGDEFPRQGLTVTSERFAELSGKNNKQGKPLIELVKKEKLENLTNTKEKKYTKTDIYRLSTAELREVAKYDGISDADNLTGSEIKKILLKKFEQ